MVQRWGFEDLFKENIKLDVHEDEHLILVKYALIQGSCQESKKKDLNKCRFKLGMDNFIFNASSHCTSVMHFPSVPKG